MEFHQIDGLSNIFSIFSDINKGQEPSICKKYIYLIDENQIRNDVLSITMDFDLVCDRKMIPGLIVSLTAVASMFASLFVGTLSGNKKIIS